MQTVCVQGLGFVGAAMATAVAIARDAGGRPIYDVIGVDLDTRQGRQRVDALNDGRFPFETSDPKLVEAVLRASTAGNLRATTDPSVYSDADIIIVDIHLDIPFRNEEPTLEFDNFVEGLRTIGHHMREEALVIIETTVPPGTCEKVVVPTLADEFEQRGLDPQNLRVAHSYERVMPGREYLDSIVNFWRVFSGHTEKAADQCEEFLSKIVNARDYPLTRLSSTTASETAKVMENTYRAVNISFIDEWTRFAEKVGIDLFEVVHAIQKRPTHANLRFPGLGIGGYCLTKDPSFTPAAARQLFGHDLEFPYSRLALQVTSRMPYHALERLAELLGGALAGKKILLCGVSYRQDVADTRYSPSEVLVRELRDRNAVVDFHDPYVMHWEELEEQVLNELPSPDAYDAVIFAVPHSDYQTLELDRWVTRGNTTLFLDAFMVFSKEQRSRFRDAGIRIEAIGVGNGL